MNNELIKSVVSNMKATDAQKKAILASAIDGNPHALFALNGMLQRQIQIATLDARKRLADQYPIGYIGVAVEAGRYTVVHVTPTKKSSVVKELSPAVEADQIVSILELLK